MNQYSAAFGCSIWFGIGNADRYNGKQCGPNYDLYEEMVTNLRSAVQEFEVVLTSEKCMAKFDLADTYHCATVLKSTLV